MGFVNVVASCLNLRYAARMEPVSWNVVVVGAWNPAILTPAWVGKTIFGLPAGSPVDVLVPMDSFGRPPFQVRHDGVLVELAAQQLIIQLTSASADSLEKAKTGAQAAIADLPRTPLQACGINLRFSAPEPPSELLARTRSETEQILSDAGYVIHTRRRGETLVFRDGKLNITMDVPTTGACVVTVNFERVSESAEDIVGWLRRPASEYVEEAEKIIALLSE